MDYSKWLLSCGREVILFFRTLEFKMYRTTKRRGLLVIFFQLNFPRSLVVIAFFMSWHDKNVSKNLCPI